MDSESTINFKRKSGFFENRRLEAATFFVFFAFMAFGARAVTFEQVDAQSLLTSELALRSTQSFLNVFTHVLQMQIIDFIIIFLSGLTVFGAGISFLWIAVFGMKIGIISGGLYKYFGLSGFGCFCTTLLPFCALSLVVYSILNAQSVKLSVGLFKYSFLGNTKPMGDIRLYFMRAVVLLIASGIIALIEAAARCFFTGFFI